MSDFGDVLRCLIICLPAVTFVSVSDTKASFHPGSSMTLRSGGDVSDTLLLANRRKPVYYKPVVLTFNLAFRHFAPAPTWTLKSVSVKMPPSLLDLFISQPRSQRAAVKVRVYH